MAGWRVVAWLCLAAVAAAAGSGAAELYRAGREAEQSGEIAKAYLLYAQAAALDPGNRDYWSRSQALRRRAVLESPPKLADASPAGPFPGTASLTDQELAEARRPLPPPELSVTAGRQSFDLRGDSRKLFEQVAQAYGLEVVFDGDYQPAAALRFRLDVADYRQALRALETLTGSFVRVLSERVFMVFRDTQQKRAEAEPTVAVLVPIPQPVAVQEAQEMARTVQQTMEILKFVVDSQRRLVLIKDRLSKVRPAQRLFELLLRHRPEVAIEVELLDVSEKSSWSYGAKLPTLFPLVNFGQLWRSSPSIPAGFARFLAFGAGKTFLGLGLADAELFASMTRSSARTLMQATMRSLDGQPASLHVGDKYPVISVGYFGNTEGSGQVYTPPPTFNFEDLGLVLKITPRIHDADSISLEVESEFKVLTGAMANGIPVISNRKFQSRVRLHNGQWAVVAGLVSSTEGRTLGGLAGTGGLSVLGALVRQNTRDRDSRQTLLVLRPRILYLPPGEEPTPSIWVGGETRPLSPM